MKMSKENYEKFKQFYDYVVETASDEDMEIIFMTLSITAKKMVELGKNRERLVIKSKHKA